MTGQLDLFADSDPLCRYGQPKAGEDRPCDRPATHAACWFIPERRPDGSLNVRAGSGRIECCRGHANYYATAWCPNYAGMTDSAWIEVLDPEWAHPPASTAVGYGIPD